MINRALPIKPRHFKSMIKDDELGRQAAEIEQTKSASAEETRRKIKEAMESRYTAPD
jgi:hypothetical protein